MIRSRRPQAGLLRRLGGAAALIGGFWGGASGAALAEPEARLAMRAPAAAQTPALAPSAERLALEADRLKRREEARRLSLTILALLSQGGQDLALRAALEAPKASRQD